MAINTSYSHQAFQIITAPFRAVGWVGSQIASRIDQVVTGLAFGDQFADLQHFLSHETNADRKTLWQAKVTDLTQHVQNVSFLSKTAIILHKTINKILFVRQCLLKYVIHPSIREFNYRSLLDPTLTIAQQYLTLGMNRADRMVKNKEASTINLYTDDHKQLDGYVVYADSNDHDLKKRPVVVMVPGNFAYAEGYLDLASNYAKALKVNVVLYNPRGVGKSLSQECSTQDAILDFKAAAQFAIHHVGEKNTFIYGQSLGGGISAAGLEYMKKEGSLADGVGLYVNHNSFSSLHGFLGGQSNSRLAYVISRIGLFLIGLNPLNNYNAIVNTKLADRVIVNTAGQDELMVGMGRASTFLKEHRESELVNRVSFIDIEANGHNDEDYLVQDENNVWRPTYFFDSEDQTQACNYFEAIKTWADESAQRLNKESNP
jgi:hypothetical protein